MNTLSRWTRRIILLAALAAAVSPALHAQNELAQARLNVPFAFNFASRHFAAGAYELDLSSPRLLTIRAVDGSMAATAMLQEEITTQPPVRSKAVFLKSGSSYQLQAIWTAGSNQYFHAIRSKAKKHSELASNRAPTAAVELALLEEPTHAKQ